MKKSLRITLLASTAILMLLTGAPASAADNTTEALKALQDQINVLQKQLAEMQAKDKARAEAEAAKAAAAPVQTASAASDKADKKEILPGVSVKVGGYIAMEGLYRSKNQTNDMTSNINTSIPFNSLNNAHTSEFRGSARATRLSLLAEGSPDADTKLGAYVETDFQGSAPSSNSVQTTSYVPRLRHAYMTVDRTDWGFYFLGGQSYSLMALYKTGLAPRQEAGVATIDGAGPPGYVYTRAPQVRFVKDFDDKNLNVGISFENPQVNFAGLVGNAPPTDIAANNTSSSLTSSSMDFAPDVVAKAAYDTSIGHFEIFGLTRFFRDEVKTSGHKNYAVGYGGGVGAFIPVIPKQVEVVGHFMGGQGIGRYSSAQMPDYAFSTTGGILPLKQLTGMFGVITHPTKTWDVYAYVGGEKVMRENVNGGDKTRGYGNFDLNTTGCDILGGTCDAQTQSVWQFTPGVWKTVYSGAYGSMKVGAQYSLTRRDGFSGQDNVQPHTYENMGFMSIRYSPF